MSSPEKIAELAGEFTLELSSTLSSSEIWEVISRNATEPNPSICHSHDFCDANEVMFAAWKRVMGSELDLLNDAQCADWQSAWDQAKAAWQTSVEA